MLRDARIYQILFLSLFLVVGIVTRDWTLQPGMIVVTIATCLTVQWLALAIRSLGADQPGDTVALSDQWLTASLSPLVTGLGLSLLLRADHPTTLMLAAGAAILSKFLLRIGDKHWFNPGNFGIIVALSCTADAWVSPGQWGEEGWYVLLFLAAGGIVLGRVGRWDTSLAFLGCYAALEAVRNGLLGWTWDVWQHRLMSGSLLVFALFMITDPRTIPNSRRGRIVWASAIALLTFVLRNQFFLSTAVFWALFFLAPLTPFLDRLFPDSRFTWSESSPQTASMVSS